MKYLLKIHTNIGWEKSTKFLNCKVYALINAGQYSRKPIAYFKPLFFLAVERKMELYCCCLNVKIKVRIRHVNIKDGICSKKKNHYSFLLLYLVR